MTDVVVTGGAGFIGQHLVAALLERGARVTVLDNFSTGRRKVLPDHPMLTVLEGCVTRPPALPRPEVIYNLACPASPPRYQADPIGTWRASVIGTEAMLELARESGARLVQASTSEVYGDPDVSPQREDYHGRVNPTGPRACYDEGKRAAEALIADYHRRHGLDTRVARIFNTYGPGMDPEDGRVVSNFITQALRGEAMTVYGDGVQTRSFCHVRDMVRGLLALGTQDGLAGEIVNLGNPVEITVRRLAEMVAAALGQPLRIELRPAVVDDPRQRRPDISRASRLLGWAPEVPLAEGLGDTIGHFREALSLA